MSRGSRADSSTDPPLSPVFVVGMPRSGTTWVMRMLAAHPQAWPLFETYMFSPYRGLAALLRDVPDERPDEELEVIELAPAGLGRIFIRPELVAELREISRRWLDLATPPGRHYVIEKSPWHLSQVDVIAEVLPEARFVNILRDGRDVAVSLVAARRSWSKSGPTPPTSEVLAEAARKWQQAVEELDEARDAVGTALLELRYDEISADPSGACRALFRHCSMPFDDALVAEVAMESSFDRRPEPKGEEMPLRGGRVGDWRERFGRADAEGFERLAGGALRRTGYEPDPDWWQHCPAESRL